MKYRIEAEEKFMASQYLTFEIEADSPEEAARKVEDFGVLPDTYGDIVPVMDGEVERTIIEINHVKNILY